MKINFDSDLNYIEIYKSDNGNIGIVISAKDNTKPNSSIINSCSLTEDQFKRIVESIKNEI